MRLSQSELDYIRSRQTGIRPTNRQTVSNKRNFTEIATTYLPQKQQEQLQTAKNVLAAGAGNPIALAAGIVAGATTGSASAGAATVGAVSTLMTSLDDEYEEGEAEYMRNLGYTGGAWSLSEGLGAISGLFTGRTSQFSKDLQAYRGKQREMKRLRLKGSGDYRLTSNSLVSGGGESAGDIQIISGQRSTTIRYREYLGDVFTHPTTPGAFSIASYDINPGLVSTFPWLAPIAQQYEQWTPNGIVFEFKSTSSEYVATQALGSVIMAAEYDQLDSPFLNKSEMLNSAYANECKPSCNALHGIECAPTDRPVNILFTRSGGVPTGGDIRDYDCARFSIATQGGATANLNLGSLYVHYDITFRKEQLYNAITAKGLMYDMISTATSCPGVASATPLPTLGNGNFRQPGSTILMTIGGLGTTVIMPSWVQGGRWAVEYFCWTSNTPTSVGTIACTSNCTPAAMPMYPLTTNIYPPLWLYTNAATTQSFARMIFDVTGPNATLTFSAFNIATNRLQMHVSVYQMGNYPN